MNCSLYDCTENQQLKCFLSCNAISQQEHLLKNIYSNDFNYDYHYILCKEKNDIKGVMPFVLYKNKLGNIIHSMPYIGYGGIASAKDEKHKIFKCIIGFLEQLSKENNVKLITICTTPFKKDEYQLYKDIFKPDFERKNFYQYLDLSEDIFGNLKSKFRGNLKRNIRKCKEYGVKLEESYSLVDLKEWYDNVYLKRLNETGCTIYPYLVFKTFITELSRDRIKMVYAKIGDKIIGGGLFLNQGTSFDNFMRVVDSEYFYTQAGNMIDYWSVEYAKEIGIQYYNWQSCDEVGSSIYKYKEDWGSKVDYHYYLTKIVGDISTLRRTSIDIIKKEYKGIYVMPYEEFIQ